MNPDKLMDRLEENLTNYNLIMSKFIIIDGITQEEQDAAIEKIDKLLKHLKKRKTKKIFNMELLREYLDKVGEFFGFA